VAARPVLFVRPGFALYARVFLYGVGEGKLGATRPDNTNLAPSHVVVHVVIGGFESARNRSSRKRNVANRS
jgi:hypothetical protein